MVGSERVAESAFSVLRALEGLHNRRAIHLLLASGVIAAGLYAWAAASRNGTAAAILIVAGVLIHFTGTSAAGGVLMDAARGLPERSPADAALTGVVSVFKIAAAFVLAVLAFAGWLIALAALLYVFKIPGIGPLLFGITAPVMAIASGVAVIGLLSFGVLAPPAVWDGRSVLGATALFGAIVGKRMPEALVGILSLTILIGIVGVILAVLVGGGAAVVAALSVPILGANVNVFQFGAAGVSGAQASAYVVAGALGGILLTAVAMTALSAVFLMGANLLFLRLSDGLEAKGTEADIAKRLEKARLAADEMQARVRQRVHQAQERAQELAQRRLAAAAAAKASAERISSPADTGDPAMTCPKCAATVAPGDAFCGECGQRLAGAQQVTPEHG